MKITLCTELLIKFTSIAYSIAYPRVLGKTFKSSYPARLPVQVQVVPSIDTGRMGKVPTPLPYVRALFQSQKLATR